MQLFFYNCSLLPAKVLVLKCRCEFSRAQFFCPRWFAIYRWADCIDLYLFSMCLISASLFSCEEVARSHVDSFSDTQNRCRYVHSHAFGVSSVHGWRPERASFKCTASNLHPLSRIFGFTTKMAWKIYR